MSAQRYAHSSPNVSSQREPTEEVERSGWGNADEAEALFGTRTLLARGSRGQAVVALQLVLNQHGATLASDGIFGPLTRAAVMEFQAGHGLVVDGIVGPQTRGALQGHPGLNREPATEEVERPPQSGESPQLIEDGPYSSRYSAPEDPELQVDRGQLTFDAEGTEGGRYHTRTAHWPGGASGVTIGRGYDMGSRSYSQVYNELVAAGVPATDALDLADGAGLKGEDAQQFLSHTTLPEISKEVQKTLFEQIYQQYQGYVEEISNRADVVAAYGQVDFDRLDPFIYDVITDLRYRGDYTASTRTFLQPVMVDNDLDGLARVMSDRSLWSAVPEDRFERRKAYVEEAMQSNARNAPNTLVELDVGAADPKGILQQSRLNPTVRSAAADTVRDLQAEGWTPYVFEGWRSWARQDELYNSGRGVTGVSGGGSYHQYGLAVDICFMDDNGQVTWNAPGGYWQSVGSRGLANGFTRWGGDWGDMPHLELDPEGVGLGARRLESTYTDAGGRDDQNVEAGQEAVWERLGLPTDMDEREQS